jgi:hypothetical protein
MNARQIFAIVFFAVGLAVIGCDDSKNPLSDPQKAKPDMRLAGVWRGPEKNGMVAYYHVGRFGRPLPAGVLRLVMVGHFKDGKVDSPTEMVMFSTTLGENTYANVGVPDEKGLSLLAEKGWKPEAVESFLIFRYKIDGDNLLVWQMDVAAKQRAIETHKIKGVIKERKGNQVIKQVAFTDSTENVARLIATEGDKLFSKEPLFKLERVK